MMRKAGDYVGYECSVCGHVVFLRKEQAAPEKCRLCSDDTCRRDWSHEVPKKRTNDWAAYWDRETEPRVKVRSR